MKTRVYIPACRRILLSALLCALSTSLFAQSGNFEPGDKRSAGSVSARYNLGKQGDITISVNVWGYVRNPGLYEVPRSTNLVELISHAGGPMRYAKLNRVRIVRVMKEESGTLTKKELIINLEHLEKVDDEDLLLYPGDTVVIDHSSWPKFRDVLTVVSTTATVAAWIAIMIDVINK